MTVRSGPILLDPVDELLIGKPGAGTSGWYIDSSCSTKAP